MRSYLYETHLHTREASACAVSSGVDYIDKYIELGYAGIIVTDHFYHGNCAINRKLPWEEFIEQYCSGYEKAKAEGDRKGLSVFFGIEENFDGDEYLIYGVDKKWLIEHPQMTKWTHRELYEEVHQAGGLVVQAHPFRQRYYNSQINLHPETVDAMEAANKGNTWEMNMQAYEFCRIHNINITAGNDIHSRKSLKNNGLYAMSFDHELRDINDYINCVKSGLHYSVVCDDAIKAYDPAVPVTLPIYLYDYEGNCQTVSKDQIGL